MKMKLLKTKASVLLITLVSLSACKKNNEGSSGTTDPYNPGNTNPVQASTAVQLKMDAKFGNVLTDKTGRTLYMFSIDAGTESGCNGGCSLTWPTFYTTDATLGAGLVASDFGVITRADGSKQTTYKGWPLYNYSGDSKAGDINGDGVGTTWFVAKPDYTVMLVNKQLVGKDGVEYTSQYVPGKETVQYLTDDYGRTLYHFKFDKAKTNTFTKPDLSNNTIWPIAEVTGVKSVPSALDKALFETTTSVGKIQLTYKGWPLYNFGEDGGVRGNNKGVGVGPGVWPVNTSSTVTAP